MTEYIDPEDLEVFFQEVEQDFNIKLELNQNDSKFPVTIKEPENGISRDKAQQLLEFIADHANLPANHCGKIEKLKGSASFNFTLKLNQKTCEELVHTYSLTTFKDVTSKKLK